MKRTLLVTLLTLSAFVGFIPTAPIASAHNINCFATAGTPIAVDQTHDRVGGRADCTAHPKVRVVVRFQLFQSSGWSTIWSQTKVCDAPGDDTACAIDTIPQPGWGGLCAGFTRTSVQAAAYGTSIGWHNFDTRLSGNRQPWC